MFSPHRGRRRPRRPRTSRHVLMLCLFALMLLSPVAANASVADGLDAQREAMAQATEAPEGDLQEEPTEEPVVEPTEEPVVEPTEEPVVEPTEEPTEAPTEEPEGEQLGAIEVEYRECDPGYDIPGADPETILMECDRVDGVLFEIVASDGVPSSQLTGEFGDSHVSFTEVPTGPTTIRQVDAPGDIYVTCNGIVQNGGPETGDMPLTVNANNMSVQWNLLDDEIAFCTWFAMTEGEQVGAVEIEYRECEAGYAFLDGTDEDDLDQMLMDCSQVDGVEFTIDEGGPDGATQATGEFGDSHVSFTEVPTGMRTVTQTTTFDDTYVVCEGIVQNGGPETGVMEVPVANGAIEWNLLDEEVAFCNWFVLAAADATEVPGTETATEAVEEDLDTQSIPGPGEPRTLAINKFFCPAGADLSNRDPGALIPICQEQPVSVEFTVSDGGGGYSSTQQTSVGETSGGAIFPDVPAGNSINIIESIPAGYGQPIVICHGQNLEGTIVQPREDMLFLQGVVYIDNINVALTLCEWFNVPTQEPAVGNTVYINKHACPATYDASAHDMFDMAANCQVDAGVVNFSVFEYGGGGYDGGIKPTSGGPGPNLVTFTDVPNVKLTVYEEAVAGYTDAVAFCGVEDGLGNDVTPTTYIPAEGGYNTIPIEAPGEGNTVFCDWYNVPGAIGAGTPESELAGSINVAYWECQAGYDLANATIATLETECTATANGIPFQVSNAGGVIETQETGDINNGVVAFAEVPAGITTISQVNAPAAPRVSCEGIVSNGGPETGIMELAAPSGSVEWDLLDDEVVYCDWYTVPMGEPGDLTIYKWTCPEGYDPYAPGANPPVDCTQATDGVAFSLSDEDPNTADLQSDTGDSIPGAVRFDSLQPGNYTVSETLPEGIGSAFVWNCNFLVLTFGGEMPISEGSTFNLPFNGGSLRCDWYNVPGTDNTVTIIKWYCPEGVPYDEERTYYEQNCTQYHEGVDFKLTHGEGSTFDTTDANGKAEWTGVPLGPFSIQEYIPPQYGEPVVFCLLTAPGGGMLSLQRVEAPNGYVESEIEFPDSSYFCHWFNVPGEPGEITIYKYTCPEGYDLNAWGANPKDDCPDATNGINFTLTDDDPGTVDLQTMTGDSIDGAVYFGGLDPGPYTVIETVPPGTEYVFVLECTGHIMGVLQPYPLSMGDTLEIELGAGESIVCYWYNVPEYDPDYGRITVYKYACSTPKYTSDLDCEVYEDGKEFDLVYWDGDSWEYADTKTTDGAGKIMWINVDPGEYWLDEQDGDWCRIESEQMSDDGNWINVYDNQETVIEVYNCGTKLPGTPGKTPTKYPNTGVGPGQGPDAPAELPAFAPLAGLLALLATRRTANRVSVGHSTRRGADLVSAPVPDTEEVPMAMTLTRRKLAALLTVPLGGTALVRSGLLAQGEQVIDPLDGTPPGGTPASLCLPATPEAGGDAAECPRGPVPVTLQIAAIGVDAPVEIRETVGGVMQQPSDEAHVAWYKESARLGEVGNLWVAGHLNWWGHPEAVFFRLGTLREGDEVVLHDEDETAYTYAVEWVRQESNREPPAEDVLGMTGYEAVTLMTCGGEWDSAISEYDERTVARARRVADPGTPVA